MKSFEKAALLFLLRHLFAGIVGAVVLATGLLWFDVAKLATLIGSSEYGITATVMLYAGLMLTFGSVSMGIGIMTMNEDTRP
ncbi:hypothetical protein GBZ48_21740 [Azospirillum melinis]|uniref:Uncharacterized protein n=2 Tax=Azospirillum TaxID=191 RepID=A0A5A9GCL0_AZOLI|nr:MULTISPECIES: hypothetical protein [Azospirillum]KAA0592238.1 hypothetical protein FZ942_28885 [Azospirillum lipoferum]MBP2309363.1 hypothetical protein [Azospirillum melinis]MCP1612275.1 hypothetical protein [Azospirillum lipoferum]MDW5536503.1 hypothetical protein [Azospirillum sp. NL1]NUB01879.1 hypothetical protein [Azospirillum melinis]